MKFLILASLGFSVYNIMSSANRDHFTSSLHKCPIYLCMFCGPLEGQKPLEYLVLVPALQQTIFILSGAIWPLLRTHDLG